MSLFKGIENKSYIVEQLVNRYWNKSHEIRCSSISDLLVKENSSSYIQEKDYIYYVANSKKVHIYNLTINDLKISRIKI